MNKNGNNTQIKEYNLLLFGKQEMFDFLVANIGSLSIPRNDRVFSYVIYHDVAVFIKHFTYAEVLYNKLKSDYYGENGHDLAEWSANKGEKDPAFNEFIELANQVALKIIKGLPKYIHGSAESDDKSRNAWFKKITQNLVIDNYRLVKNISPAFSLDDFENLFGQQTSSNAPDVADVAAKKEEILSCMQMLCGKNLDVSKIIACLFAAVYKIEAPGSCNVDVKSIVEKCNNKTVEEAADLLVDCINGALMDNGGITKASFDVLYKKIKGAEDEVIELTARQITDCIHNIKKKEETNEEEQQETPVEKNTVSFKQLKKRIVNETDHIKAEVEWLVDFEKVLSEADLVREGLREAIIKAHQELPLGMGIRSCDPTQLLSEYKNLTIGKAFDKLSLFVKDNTLVNIPDAFYYRFEYRLKEVDKIAYEIVYKLDFIV